MNKRQASRVMEECIRSLPKADKTRLRYHLEQGTHILCGAHADLYADGKGGG